MLTLILTNLKSFTLGLLCVALLGVYLYFIARVDVLKHERDTAKEQIVKLNSMMADQNSAIKDLEVQTEAKDKRIKDVQKQIALNKIKEQRQIQELLAIDVPQGCEDASRWMIAQAKVVN